MPLQQGVSACARTGDMAIRTATPNRMACHAAPRTPCAALRDVINHGEVVLMANTEGLQKTLEHIKEHPKEWDQVRWHTCFAGIALRLLRGAVIEGNEDSCCNLLTLDGCALGPVRIGNMAVDALGLTGDQEFKLFHEGNTLEDLERLVAEFTTEAPVLA